MPSWFKKVFAGDAAKPEVQPQIPVAAEPAAAQGGAIETAPDLGEPSEDRPKIRTIVNAPTVVPEEEQSSWSEEIRIKARVDQDGTACTFLVDRPVLEGLSAWFPEKMWATEVAPLAEKLFNIDGVGPVMLHDTTVTVTHATGGPDDWEPLAKEIGRVIREHLKSGETVVIDDLRNNVPPETEIREKLQTCLDLEINPGIASHSGVITLNRVEGNTVYVTMGGGCQGCAASTITLRQGIHSVFRKAVPEIGAIYDETDHSSGTNPYFNELPAGMS